MRFDQFSDAHIQQEQKQDFFQSIVEHVVLQITQEAIQESTAYTQQGMENVCSILMNGIQKALNEHHVNWDKQIDTILPQFIDTNTDKVIPCRKCQMPYPVKEMRSGTLTKKSALEHLGDIVDKYFLLCINCEQEYLYHFQGRTATCQLCSVRHDPFERRPLEYEKVPELNKKMLCIECCQIPNIWDEVERIIYHNKRANKCNLIADLTIKQWIGTLNHFKWKCAYCLGEFDNMEHYSPIALGGGTTASNCLPSCKHCNNRKKDKHPADFARLFPADNLARIRAYLASVE